MHDYTASHIHEGRMRELTREADAVRLAAVARAGRTPRDTRRGPRRLLSVGVFRLWFEAWRSPRAARP
jgi:hypothetical protein